MRQSMGRWYSGALVLGLCMAAAVPPAPCWGRQADLPAAQSADQSGQKKLTQLIRQGLVDFRAARGDTARRVKAVVALVALGPEGVAAVDDLFRGELGRLGKAVGEGSPTAELDAKVAELRKKLAELRADPNLSKEQLHETGLPALDELTAVWQQREAALEAYYLKLSKVREQIAGMVELLKVLKNESAAGALDLADRLSEAEALLAKATKPEDPDARRILEENVKLAAEIDPKEVAGMQALNAMRIMCGLRPLLYDPKLCNAARDHSKDMEQKGFFSHESPVPGKTTFADRAKLAGTTASGENIYMGSGSPVDAMKGWFLSPGHHKNMLNDSNTRQGLGRVGRHWTQMFGH